MKKIISFMSIVAVCLAASVFCLWLSNGIGVFKHYIEEQAREKQNISEDWRVSEYTTDRLSAMVFYNDDLTEHTFSLYINRDGLSLGYFFWQGGIDMLIQNSVGEFRIEDSEEIAYISMNSKGASFIRISNESDITTKEIAPDKPFAIIVDERSLVEFLDADGKLLYE